MTYLCRSWPERLVPGAAERLFFFERATNFSAGVSPVFPVLLLGFGFYWWGSRHLKRLFLLGARRVTSPFPEGPPFDQVGKCDGAVWEVLERPHAAGGTWTPVVWLVLFFTYCRLANRFAPSVEGPLFDGVVLFALALFSLFLVDALLQLIATCYGPWPAWDTWPGRSGASPRR